MGHAQPVPDPHDARSRAGSPHLSIWVAAGAFLVLMGSACGSDAHPQSEDYGNLLASPGGLVVLMEEHPTGWMRPDCFGCHSNKNIHQVNRTGLPDEEVDLPGIRAIIRTGGEASCPMCHGSNGTPP
ncbi:MAG: hypothetical protein AB7N53_19930 [Candidatus Binatia bacterium]